MKILTFLFLMSSTLCHAQSLVLLKKIITTTNLTSETGLSTGINGKLNENGLYYFEASHTGTLADVWQTDGTPANTVKIESEPVFNLWDRVYFVKDGLFIDTYSEKLLYYSNDTDILTELVFVDDLEIYSPVAFGDGKYLFLVDSLDTVSKLWISDRTVSGTYEIGNVGNYNGFNKLYASPMAAVVYNSNFFVDFEAKIYDPVADSILEIRDYLAPYKSVNSVTYATVYENLLFLTVEENAGVKHYIFDLVSHTFYPSVSLETVDEFKRYNGNLFIMTEREIVRVDLSTYAIKKETYLANPGGQFLFHEDQLYFQINISGNTYKIAKYELNDYTITTYQDLDINALSNNNPKMAIHDGDLFFIKGFPTGKNLVKYDFVTQTQVIIDTVAVGDTRSYTTELIEVNGILLASKAVPDEGHEMYYYDATTGTLEPYAIEQVVAFPNPTHDEIQLNIVATENQIVTLYNSAGHRVMQAAMHGNSIHVNDLVPGSYHGILNNGIDVFRFSFIKD